MHSPNSLLLFDIDGTMVSTGGAGVRAMHQAGQELYGPHFSINGLDFAGRLDPLLVDELFQANCVPLSDPERIRFRARYRECLQRSPLAPPAASSMPGVLELLQVLRQTPSAVLGVLTGNFQETAEIKLSSCGIDPAQFKVSVWGDESPHSPPDREHLPPVAMAKYSRMFEREIPPHRVTVIGDTPHDVRCAKRNGCRSLAVATGKFTVPELQGCEPDRVVANLSDVHAIARWLLSV